MPPEATITACARSVKSPVTFRELLWPRSTLSEYGVDLKYRFVTADPVDKPNFVPAIRARVLRVVTGPRDVADARVDLIGTYESGAVQAAINVGVQGLVSGG